MNQKLKKKIFNGTSSDPTWKNQHVEMMNIKNIYIYIYDLSLTIQLNMSFVYT